MEIFLLSITPRCHVVNLRCQLSSIFRQPESGTPRISLASSLHYRKGCLREKNSLSNSSKLGSLQRSNSSALSGTTSSYVIRDDEVGSGGGGGNSEPVGKVLIPGLPSEAKGASVRSCFWEWKPKLKVHYEKAGWENLESPQVLFLPGFGVGSFHYEKQLKDLGRQYRVWAIDFLGQGLSLPVEDPTSVSGSGKNDALRMKDSMWGFGDEAQPWASELVYSIDLWRDQVRYFVQEVNGKSPLAAKVFPWSGTFPLPARVKMIMHFLWSKISDRRSITEVLKQVYADQTTDVDKVISRVVEITEHPAAAASLTSIMFAPTARLSFTEALSSCKRSNVPICLVYGREDPWVRPIWGLDVKRQLPEAPYYELSPAGHCPHDEVPEVVNYLLRGWIKNLESNGSFPLPLLDDDDDGNGQSVENSTAKSLEFGREEGSKKSVLVRFVGSDLTFWEHLRFSQFK
ncbi:Pheophytinase, chloroplastic [Linum perenne]